MTLGYDVGYGDVVKNDVNCVEWCGEVWRGMVGRDVAW